MELDKLCESADRLCKLQESNFHETRKNVDVLISSKYSSETLFSERSLLVTQFEKYTEAHSEYLSVAPKDVSDFLIAAMSHDVERFHNSKSLIDKYVSSSKEKLPRRPLQLERMPLPKFDGVIRNYPQFKNDSEEL